MVNQKVWIGIVVGVFFVGIGISYAMVSSTYNPISMKFQNQELFENMMSQNPKMTEAWMEAMMGDEEFMHEMTEMMSEHGTQEPMMGSMMEQSPMEEHEMMLGLMEEIIGDEELSEHMMAHIMEDQGFTHQLFTFMGQSPEMLRHMEAHVTGDVSALEKFQGGE